MREKIIKILTEKHHSSGGHCGTYLIDFKLEINELKKELEALSIEGKIEVRDGIHGELIKLKE